MERNYGKLFYYYLFAIHDVQTFSGLSNVLAGKVEILTVLSGLGFYFVYISSFIKRELHKFTSAT